MALACPSIDVFSESLLPSFFQTDNRIILCCTLAYTIEDMRNINSLFDQASTSSLKELRMFGYVCILEKQALPTAVHTF